MNTGLNGHCNMAVWQVIINARIRKICVNVCRQEKAAFSSQQDEKSPVDVKAICLFDWGVIHLL